MIKLDNLKCAITAGNPLGGVLFSPKGSSPKPKEELISNSVTTSELMERFSKKNPKFASLLTEASKSLAPLATTSEGRQTITSLRMAAGLTQKELANKIGQQQANISYLESGQRPNIHRDTMRRLCVALNCDMNTLDDAIDNTVSMLDQRIAQQEATQKSNAHAVVRRCA